MRKNRFKNRTNQDWYQYHKNNAGNDSVATSSLVKAAKENLQAAELKLLIFQKNHSQSLSSDLRKFFLGKKDCDHQLDQLQASVDMAKKKFNDEVAKAHNDGTERYRKDWAERNPDKIKSN